MNQNQSEHLILFNRWPLILIAVGVAAIDQLAKWAVVNSLAIGQSWEPIPAVAAFFQITRSANSGAAFSILQGSNLPLLLVSLIMLVAIGWYAGRLSPDTRGQLIALGFLAGGVLGNAIDRLRFGTVVDFIHWQIPGLISNVSNLADHAIVFSVIGLFILQVRADAKPDVSA